MAAPKTKKSIMRKKILGFDFVDSGTEDYCQGRCISSGFT